MLLLVSALVIFALAFASWRAGWYGAARFFAAALTLVASLAAAYQWQAYGRGWMFAFPLLFGAPAIAACGLARGESVDKASGGALLLAGLPILLMLMTFGYFGKMFLLIRADAAARRAAPERSVKGYIGVLSSEDAFARWGALHLLWIGREDASAAAGPVADAVLSVRADTSAKEEFYLRRDGLGFLKSLGPAGRDGLLKLAREGDPELHRDALWALGMTEEDWKKAAAPPNP